jgi:hypothetical protein
MIAVKCRESYEGKWLESFFRLLNKTATELIDYYDEDNYCSKLYLGTLNFNTSPMKNMLFHFKVEVILLI